MVFRKVYIVLCAALLAAGDLCAQQVRVEPRIAGLEGNREYMSLLEQDAQLQIREDSIVNAVERARRQLRILAKTPRTGSAIRRRSWSSKAGYSRCAMPRGA